LSWKQKQSKSLAKAIDKSDVMPIIEAESSGICKKQCELILRFRGRHLLSFFPPTDPTKKIDI